MRKGLEVILLKSTKNFNTYKDGLIGDKVEVILAYPVRLEKIPKTQINKVFQN